MSILEANITDIIPQQPPFVMVDRLIHCDDITSVTSTTVNQKNVLVENGEFTEAGLLENIAQTAAAGVGYIAKKNGTPVFTGYIGAIKNLEVYGLPKVGETIETTVTIDKHVFDVTMITGQVNCGEALLAKCEMKIFINKQT